MPKPKYAVISWSETAEAGGILNAEYWVNKKQGKDPYFVQDNELVAVDAKKGTPTSRRLLWLNEADAVAYRKLLAKKQAVNKLIKRLEGDMDAIENV